MRPRTHARARTHTHPRAGKKVFIAGVADDQVGRSQQMPGAGDAQIERAQPPARVYLAELPGPGGCLRALGTTWAQHTSNARMYVSTLNERTHARRVSAGALRRRWRRRAQRSRWACG